MRAACRAALSVAAAVVVLGLCPAANAGTYYIYGCSSYGNTAPAFSPQLSADHLAAPNACMQPAPGGGYRSLEINGSTTQSVRYGYGANWTASAPSPAIAVIGAYTPPNSVLADCSLSSDGFAAAFFWHNGSRTINFTSGCNSRGFGWGSGISQGFPPSSDFGWGVVCAASPSCTPSTNDILGVDGIRLTAEENTGPTLNAVPASNLWYQSAWVRGSWPITLDASDPSGVCWLLTVVDGRTVSGWRDPAPDTSRFTQCHGSQLPGQLGTTSYANGQHTLAYAAYNAASVPSSATKTISIDNAPVGLGLSGPTDALSSAGTQYVHATATAGPSGVGAILCSVDGSAFQRFGGASAQVPVSGIGAHRVGCYAQNKAVDASGSPAISPTQGWSLTIRDPTVSAISFTRVVDALRCHKAHERVRRHGHWTTIRVTRCHPRVAWRRQLVWKIARRSGKVIRIAQIKEVRVVLLPRVVGKAARRVPFGHGTTVSGWLGFPSGTAIAGQQVRVLTAPNNAQHAFTQLGVVTTGPDGSWKAQVPPGPSRLLVAAYDGSGTTEPTASSAVTLTVPARIRLVRIRPRHVRWGGTVHIEGYLAGGYLPPPPAGELVRLRIGIGSQYTTYGVKIDVTGNGRFVTRYRFGAGAPSISRDYWFQLQALPQDDYPFAPSDSGRAAVHVGG